MVLLPPRRLLSALLLSLLAATAGAEPSSSGAAIEPSSTGCVVRLSAAAALPVELACAWAVFGGMPAADEAAPAPLALAPDAVRQLCPDSAEADDLADDDDDAADADGADPRPVFSAAVGGRAVLATRGGCGFHVKARASFFVLRVRTRSFGEEDVFAFLLSFV